VFYEPALRNHGLRHDPLKAIVAPRPIGWISSLSADGVANLAPYSMFNMMSETHPIIVGFSSTGRKDSLTNIEATGEFVCNLAVYDLREEMNQSSARLPPEADEFLHSRLTPAPSQKVKPPRVAESPAALECVYLRTIPMVGRDGAAPAYFLVLGEVVGVHVDEAALTNGRFDITKVKTIARLGYRDYAAVTETFEMTRP